MHKVNSQNDFTNLVFEKSIKNISSKKYFKDSNLFTGHCQIDNKLYVIIKNEIDYEDVDEIVNNIYNTNFLDLNIDMDQVEKTFKNFTRLFIDKFLCKISESYNLKSVKKNDLFKVNFKIDDKEILKTFEEIEQMNEIRTFARMTQDMPPNILTADKFSSMYKNKLDKFKDLKITIFDEKELAKKNMNLILAVNGGSPNKPRVMIVEYNGNPSSKEKLALVGKGITFDSGGYSLKNWKKMQMMKYDMCGAAVVTSVMESLAINKPKINVVSIACLTDNLIGSKQTVTDSVITSHNGITVEIQNTDCEGRLVLADGVSYAVKELNATNVITIATLTGAVSQALGYEFTGVMTNNNAFLNDFHNLTINSTERFWKLPLSRINTKNQYHSKIADIWNEAPSSAGGASNGAAFVELFVEKKPFLHFDISGTAGGKDRSATGVMVSTLIEYINKK